MPKSITKNTILDDAKDFNKKEDSKDKSAEELAGIKTRVEDPLEKFFRLKKSSGL